MIRAKSVAPVSSKYNKPVIGKNTETFKFLQKVEGPDGLLFTEKDAKYLSSLKFHGDFFLDIEYNPSTLYEIVGSFNKLSMMGKNFQLGFDFLESIKDDESIDKDSNPSEFIFKGPWFEDEKDEYENDIQRLKQKITTKTGIYKCPVCVKNGESITTNTETVEIQTRSSDEPMSVFNKCNNCDHAWNF